MGSRPHFRSLLYQEYTRFRQKIFILSTWTWTWTVRTLSSLKNLELSSRLCLVNIYPVKFVGKLSQSFCKAGIQINRVFEAVVVVRANSCDRIFERAENEVVGTSADRDRLRLRFVRGKKV